MTDVSSGPKRDVTRKRPGIAAPTTVSGAVRLAIDDGRALLEGEDRYVFHYSRWHEAHTPDTCSVCAAGAVMARQFDIEGKTMLAYDFDEAWNRVLWTIDAVREQNFALAFGAMVPGGYRTPDANVLGVTLELIKSYSCLRTRLTTEQSGAGTARRTAPRRSGPHRAL